VLLIACGAVAGFGGGLGRVGPEQLNKMRHGLLSQLYCKEVGCLRSSEPDRKNGADHQ
jgi:hypothetical protein